MPNTTFTYVKIVPFLMKKTFFQFFRFHEYLIRCYNPLIEKCDKLYLHARVCTPGINTYENKI